MPRCKSDRPEQEPLGVPFDPKRPELFMRTARRVAIERRNEVESRYARYVEEFEKKCADPRQPWPVLRETRIPEEDRAVVSDAGRFSCAYEVRPEPESLVQAIFRRARDGYDDVVVAFLWEEGREAGTTRSGHVDETGCLFGFPSPRPVDDATRTDIPADALPAMLRRGVAAVENALRALGCDDFSVRPFYVDTSDTKFLAEAPRVITAKPSPTYHWRKRGSKPSADSREWARYVDAAFGVRIEARWSDPDGDGSPSPPRESEAPRETSEEFLGNEEPFFIRA